MSTYILMKFLESAPSRYDLGIQLITLGTLTRIYDHLISTVKSGQQVLDLGCGTGALTLRAARKGAKVKGIDINPQMLKIAHQRIEEAKLGDNVQLCEMGVAELDSEPPNSYDVVISGLCFSELSPDEIDFTLKQVMRILKPGGFLLIADEITPPKIFKRILHWMIRIPLLILTYLFTQTTTRPVINLPQKLAETGFHLESITLNRMENFAEIVAKKPEGKKQ